MADIFGRSNQVFAGAFPVDGARISFAGNDGDIVGVGLLSQSLGYQYNQPITLLYEIGTNNTCIVTGRARGGVQIQRVLGPRPVVKGFYTKYGDVCNAATNILNLEARSAACAAQAGGEQFALGMTHCLIEGMAGTVSSENGLMTENLQMRFLGLELN